MDFNIETQIDTGDGDVIIIRKLNEGERHLFEYQNDMSGSFYTALFTAIFKADRFNRERLRLAFSEEVEAVIRFENEDGYWEEIQRNYK